jgi:hypothetical protein
VSPWRFDHEDDALAREVQAMLSPIRSQTVDVDVAPRVMRRIALSLPRPAPRPLPAPWARLALASSLFLGLVALGTLIATALSMLASGDEGARAALTLASTTGQELAQAFAVAGGFLLALAQAGLALARGAWAVIEVAAPLVRSAGTVGALCGLLSIAFSIVVVHRAGKHAPLAVRTS